MAKSWQSYHLSALAAFVAGDLPKALLLTAQAIAVEPRVPATYANIGTAFGGSFQDQEMVDAYRTALLLNPNHIEARRNLIVAAGYDQTIDASERLGRVLEMTQPWNDIKPKYVHQTRGCGERALRVGLISSDFRSHPVAYNSLAIFEEPRSFELYCYSLVQKPDMITAQLKGAADQWREAVGLEDALIAEMIYQDQIDIAIYVGGWFDDNRPQVAAYGPAPCQASLFAGATTGIKAIQFHITDPVTDPPGNLDQYVEGHGFAYMPHWLYYSPVRNMVDVVRPPAINNGYVTFGVFNRATKITREAVALWAEIMKALPTSKIIFRYRTAYNDPVLCAKIRIMFGAHGISPERISFGTKSKNYHEAFNEIDVQLDTLAFSGATTTFDALWMGVPTITLEGKTGLQRMSMSILSQVQGCDGMIAATKQEYVNKALSHAAYFTEQRMRLRQSVQASTLCNSSFWMHHFEKCLQEMWEKTRC